METEALIVSAFRGDLGKARQGYIINVLDSVKALVELGLEVTVLGFGNSEPDIDANWDLIPIRGPRVSLYSLRARYELYKRLLRYKPRLLYVHHSPDFPSSLLLRRGEKRVLHLHDLLSDVAARMYGLMSTFLYILYAYDEAISAKFADLAIAPSEEMCEILQRLGYKRTAVAYNRPGPVEPKESELADLIKSLKRPVIVYAGTVQRGVRGIEELYKIAKVLGGTLVTIGKKETELPKDVVYHPPVPRNELIGAIRYADFGAIGKTIPYALPAKIFDYLYAELPIITHADNRAIVRLLRRYERPYIAYRNPNEVELRPLERKKFPSDIKSRKECIKEAVSKILFR